MINQKEKITSSSVPFKNVKKGEFFEYNGILYKKTSKSSALSDEGCLLKMVCNNTVVIKINIKR